jgi:hypothetical protein
MKKKGRFNRTDGKVLYTAQRKGITQTWLAGIGFRTG